MKIILFIMVCSIFLFVSSEALASAFCDGWSDGYIEGYCYQKFGCLQPLVPLCPLPRIGEKTYQDGYNLGFLVGLSARR